MCNSLLYVHCVLDNNEILNKHENNNTLRLKCDLLIPIFPSEWDECDKNSTIDNSLTWKKSRLFTARHDHLKYGLAS